MQAGLFRCIVIAQQNVVSFVHQDVIYYEAIHEKND